MEPLPTVTCPNRGELTLISPTLIQSGYGERPGQGPRVPGLGQPLGTVVAGGIKHALTSSVLVGAGGPEYSGKPATADQPVGTLMIQNHRAVATAFMAQMNGGFNTTDAKGMDEPLTTVTNTGSQQQMVSANLVHLRGNCDARAAEEPLRTISAGGEHHGLVSAFMERAFGASVGQGLEEPAPTTTAGGSGKSSLVSLKLSPEHEAGALRVAAFLVSYYGTENISACDAPTPTITTKDRLAMVTVMVKGTPYVIVDICLRMLKPSELYKAQGFPADYVISHGADGKPFTKTQQVHMCGNSVSPPPMAALARANDPWLTEDSQACAA
jgi:DNA (cytosine-5)-methyltransferase 1